MRPVPLKRTEVPLDVAATCGLLEILPDGVSLRAIDVDFVHHPETYALALGKLADLVVGPALLSTKLRSQAPPARHREAGGALRTLGCEVGGVPTTHAS